MGVTLVTVWLQWRIGWGCLASLSYVWAYGAGTLEWIREGDPPLGKDDRMVSSLLSVDPGTFAVLCVGSALTLVVSVLLYVGKGK